MYSSAVKVRTRRKICASISQNPYFSALFRAVSRRVHRVFDGHFAARHITGVDLLDGVFHRFVFLVLVRMIGKPGKSAALFEKRMHFSVSEFLIDPVKGGSGIYEIKRVFLRVKILKTAVYACEMRVGRKLLVADVRKMRPAFNGCDFAAAF